MPNLIVGGEVITAGDAMKLVDTIYERAYDIAGAFYENNRSEKFRSSWPNVYEYADANKKAFVAQARADFSRILADPHGDEKQKRRVYLAMLLERAFSEGLAALGRESNTRLQVMRETQQFEGESRENRKTIDNFGRQESLRAVLMRGATKLGRMH